MTPRMLEPADEPTAAQARQRGAQDALEELHKRVRGRMGGTYLAQLGLEGKSNQYLDGWTVALLRVESDIAELLGEEQE